MDTVQKSIFRSLREDVTSIHQILLHSEAKKQEQLLERRLGPYDLWHLSVEHAQFAWIRMVSEIIVLLDVELEKEGPFSEELAKGVGEELTSLFLAPQTKHEEFHQKLQEVLETTPELHLLRGSLTKHLLKLTSGKEDSSRFLSVPG